MKRYWINYKVGTERERQLIVFALSESEAKEQIETLYKGEQVIFVEIINQGKPLNTDVL
jgi:hypothetical protein